MDPIRTAAGAALAAAALGAAALAQPPPLAWPEAIARLAAERTRANTCVEQARALGVAATDPLARGYGEAKAEVDGVIAGLAVALAERREPAALAELERRMAAGVEGRQRFCEQVAARLPPPPPGQKGVLVDVLGGVVGPVVEAVAEALGDAAGRRPAPPRDHPRATGGHAMARLRRLAALALTALLALAPEARAQEAPPPGFHDRPVLVVDPGRHTAPIRRADADAAGRLAATASDDKTVRLWSLADGALLRTIRLPAGPGNVGQAHAVALDPAGALVAAGGWTAPRPPTRSTSTTRRPARCATASPGCRRSSSTSPSRRQAAFDWSATG